MCKKSLKEEQHKKNVGINVLWTWFPNLKA